LKGTVKTMGKFDAVIIGAIVITVGLICYALGDWMRGRDDEALIRQYETELDRRPAQVMPPEIAHEPRPDEAPADPAMVAAVLAVPWAETTVTLEQLHACQACATMTGPGPCRECGATLDVTAWTKQMALDMDAWLNGLFDPTEHHG
jgi:hypothetical protein